jgi:hypothetical protein
MTTLQPNLDHREQQSFLECGSNATALAASTHHPNPEPPAALPLLPPPQPPLRPPPPRMLSWKYPGSRTINRKHQVSLILFCNER